MINELALEATNGIVLASQSSVSGKYLHRECIGGFTESIGTQTVRLYHPSVRLWGTLDLRKCPRCGEFFTYSAAPLTIELVAQWAVVVVHPEGLAQSKLGRRYV